MKNNPNVWNIVVDGHDETSFVHFMEDVIERLLILNRIGTAENYISTLNSLKRFLDGKSLMLEAVNEDVVEEYQAYLYANGVSRNTSSFYMRVLRAVYRRAVKRRLVADANPFVSVFTGVDKTLKRAISEDELSRIKSLNLCNCFSLAFARDIFIFLFLCRGMSFVDASFLRKTDIANGVLTYVRRKTSQTIHIRLVPQMQEIIDRYTIMESPYLLPIITDPGGDERKQYQTALHRINRALKTISIMARVQKNLTTYVSRHSWATIAKTKNIPVTIISDALGHDSVPTTQIYLASIDTNIIDDANDVVIGGI